MKMILTDEQMNAIRDHFFTKDPRYQYGMPYSAELIPAWEIDFPDGLADEIRGVLGKNKGAGA